MNILIKSLYRYESQSNNSLLALKHLPKCARENLKKSIQTDVAKVMASWTSVAYWCFRLHFQYSYEESWIDI